MASAQVWTIGVTRLAQCLITPQHSFKDKCKMNGRKQCGFILLHILCMQTKKTCDIHYKYKVGMECKSCSHVKEKVAFFPYNTVNGCSFLQSWIHYFKYHALRTCYGMVYNYANSRILYVSHVWRDLHCT